VVKKGTGQGCNNSTYQKAAFYYHCCKSNIFGSETTFYYGGTCKLDHYSSVPPRNPRHILESVDGSGDDVERDPGLKPNLVGDHEDNEEVDGEEEAPEAPEESAEAELSMFLNSCIRD